MDLQNRTCSSSKHAEINAVFYCPECQKYLCNKCLGLHTELFEDHKIINLNEKKEIFIDICKEENHNEKLKFYCKEHNILCCAFCTSKIKKEGYGQHSDCDINLLEEIEDKKRKKLQENINNLNELYNQIDPTINKLKKMFEKINKNNDDIKLQIQSIFTKLRNTLNEREDKLLLDIDEYYNNIYFKEDIIKKSEKLPNKIKNIIEKGKIIDKEWNEHNLSYLINECIKIENDINEINIINDNIKKYNSNKDIKIIYILKKNK